MRSRACHRNKNRKLNFPKFGKTRYSYLGTLVPSHSYLPSTQSPLLQGTSPMIPSHYSDLVTPIPSTGYSVQLDTRYSVQLGTRYSILPGTRYCCSVRSRHHPVIDYVVAGLWSALTSADNLLKERQIQKSP